MIRYNAVCVGGPLDGVRISYPSIEFHILKSTENTSAHRVFPGTPRQDNLDFHIYRFCGMTSATGIWLLDGMTKDDAIDALVFRYGRS